MIKSSASNWNNTPMPEPLPYLDSLEFQGQNQAYLFDDFVERLNDFEYPIRKIGNYYSSDHSKVTVELNETLVQSIEEYNVRFNEQIAVDYQGYTDLLTGAFPNLKKINLFLNGSSWEQTANVLSEASVKDIEEFNSPASYSPQIGFDAKIKARNCIVYFQFDNFSEFGAIKFRNLSLNVKKMLEVKIFNDTTYFMFQGDTERRFSGPLPTTPGERSEANNMVADSQPGNQVPVFFIPCESITEFDVDLNPNDDTGVILNIGDVLDVIPLSAKLDMKIANKSANDSVEQILPKLAEYQINTLNLDLNYTNDGIYEATQRYLSACTSTSVRNLHLSIFDQQKLETLVSKIQDLPKKLTNLHLVLYSEAMIDLNGILYKFRVSNPLTTIIAKFVTKREPTITIAQLIKNMKLKREQEES